jgi:hypothetical protein
MTKARIHSASRRAAFAGALITSSVILLPSAYAAGQLRDGSHDFDWEVGLWKTHLKVLRHKPDGSTGWIKYEGISKVIPIWKCRANMVELDVTGPGGQHIEGINLRLYNPDSHQWSLNFANVNTGTMAVPTIGEFRNGIGTFYDQESIGGEEVLVRNVWSNVTRNSARFVQSISNDGGKTWHANWMTHDTRVPGTTDECEKNRGDATSQDDTSFSRGNLTATSSTRSKGRTGTHPFN